MSGELLLIYGVGALALVTAVGVVTARNLVHAALWMVSNFGLTAVLYLALHAPFLAAIQVLVYAGAIMVLFLFVVMLLGGQPAPIAEPMGGHRALVAAGLALLGGGLAWAIVQSDIDARPAAEVTADFGSPAAIGTTLFGDWALPFELVSFLLLVAMIGAIVIAHFRDGVQEPAGEEEAR